MSSDYDDFVNRQLDEMEYRAALDKDADLERRLTAANIDFDALDRLVKATKALGGDDKAFAERVARAVLEIVERKASSA